MGQTGQALTRVVLDTNVVVSALVFEGPSNRLVAAWQQRRFRLLVSQQLLTEYLRVLHYPKFHLTQDDIRSLVEEELLPFITPVTVSRVPRVVLADPSDDQVLGCAAAGKADVVVTGDRHLLALARYKWVRIVTLADFLRQLGFST